MSRYINALSQGVTLHGQSYSYCIEQVLGQGSFGITYLASVRMQGALGSIDAKVKVAVKEFFMREINGREGSAVTSGSKDGLFVDYRRKFVREATSLSKLSHPNIIKVLECFEANNTVYFSMEYLDGGSLDELINSRGGLPESETVRYVRQIASALSYMHGQNMLHLDLKPGNVMLSGGKAILIDFGLSKQYVDGDTPESSTTVGAGTPGYAPLEQASYRDGNNFPVTMDIYALGGTMYKMLVGQRPPEASEVLNDGLPDPPSYVSSAAWAAVEAAMEPMRRKRPQTVADFVRLLPESEVPADEATVLSLSGEATVLSSSDSIVKFTVKGVSFKMIKVYGGTFTMGATPEQGDDAYSNEKPAHEVTLSSYYIGQTEVTQELWTAVMGSNPSYFKGRGSNLPVELVSWNDCQEFITKLNAATGRRFRLPTEAEWEYAARGGSKSRGYKYSGSDNIDDVAWYWKNSGDSYLSGGDGDWSEEKVEENNCRTHSVATKSPNELGIYDMSGNVGEWCQDWYGDYNSASAPQVNPKGATSGFSRVYRGGSWYLIASYCRSSHRDNVSPSIGYGYLGLRLALSE